MRTTRLKIENATGQNLSASLEMPVDQKPHSYAIFAHCFTCNKNLLAVKNISRSLIKSGIAVLRFDFTGLGSSEGAFEQTNFSSNVQDLVSVANYLKTNYEAPSLLIGHSLGGAAVIFAAAEIESIKAIATIGAPSDPKHVKHLFSGSLDEIKLKGEAQVNLGGRPFKIQNQFVEDLYTKDLYSVISKMKKAILIAHSPQDKTVGIENAQKLYQAAFHPKSFVSLDGADHLLMNKNDSEYIGEVIATWAKRYLVIPQNIKLQTNHQVLGYLSKDDAFTTQIKAGNHALIADEPIEVGGNDFGPAPYDLVSAGLAACTVMTLKMYTSHKKWDLGNVQVHVNHKKVSEINEEGKKNKVDVFERIIEMDGDLDDTQRNRIVEIAGKCPVHKTLHLSSQINTRLK